MALSALMAFSALRHQKNVMEDQIAKTEVMRQKKPVTVAKISFSAWMESALHNLGDAMEIMIAMTGVMKPLEFVDRTAAT